MRKGPRTLKQGRFLPLTRPGSGPCVPHPDPGKFVRKWHISCNFWFGFSRLAGSGAAMGTPHSPKTVVRSWGFSAQCG